MKPVFADTFFFVAALNSADHAHARAIAWSSSNHAPLVTTSWILTEVANTLSKQQHRSGVVRLLRELKHLPRVRIVPASEQLFERGVEFYSQRLDKEWSLTDCISFVVMTDEKITDALTGDHHFEQAGFTALLK